MIEINFDLPKEQISTILSNEFSKIVNSYSVTKTMADRKMSHCSLNRRRTDKHSGIKIHQLKIIGNTVKWLHEFGYSFQVTAGDIAYDWHEDELQIREHVSRILKSDVRTQVQKAKVYDVDQSTISLLTRNRPNGQGFYMSVFTMLGIIHLHGESVKVTVTPPVSVKETA